MGAPNNSGGWRPLRMLKPHFPTKNAVLVLHLTRRDWMQVVGEARRAARSKHLTTTWSQTAHQKTTCIKMICNWTNHMGDFRLPQFNRTQTERYYQLKQCFPGFLCSSPFWRFCSEAIRSMWQVLVRPEFARFKLLGFSTCRLSRKLFRSSNAHGFCTLAIPLRSQSALPWPSGPTRPREPATLLEVAERQMVRWMLLQHPWTWGTINQAVCITRAWKFGKRSSHFTRSKRKHQASSFHYQNLVNCLFRSNGESFWVTPAPSFLPRHNAFARNRSGHLPSTLAQPSCRRPRV